MKKKKEPVLLQCLMCKGHTNPDCSLCRGTGGLEATFKKGLEMNEMESLGKMGKSGYPRVVFPAEAEPKARAAEEHALTLDEWAKKFAFDLNDDIDCHLDQWKVFDAEGLKRMLLTSIRQWSENGKA